MKNPIIMAKYNEAIFFFDFRRVLMKSKEKNKKINSDQRNDEISRIWTPRIIYVKHRRQITGVLIIRLIMLKITTAMMTTKIILIQINDLPDGPIIERIIGNSGGSKGRL